MGLAGFAGGADCADFADFADFADGAGKECEELAVTSFLSLRRATNDA